jgi:hypothetical protein
MDAESSTVNTVLAIFLRSVINKNTSEVERQIASSARKMQRGNKGCGPEEPQACRRVCCHLKS